MFKVQDQARTISIEQSNFEIKLEEMRINYKREKDQMKIVEENSRNFYLAQID